MPLITFYALFTSGVSSSFDTASDIRVELMQHQAMLFCFYAEHFF